MTAFFSSIYTISGGLCALILLIGYLSRAAAKAVRRDLDQALHDIELLKRTNEIQQRAINALEQQAQTDKSTISAQKGLITRLKNRIRQLEKALRDANIPIPTLSEEEKETA